MLKRLYDTCLLRPADVPASDERLEVIGVFNPGVAEVDGEVVLLVRVAERPREQRPGKVALPRYTPEGALIVDWHKEDEVEGRDPRFKTVRADGSIRLTFVSHLRVLRCGDGRRVRHVEDVLFLPRAEEETFGVEDPRVTKIGETFYFTYVAVSPHGATTALASTQDFRTFTRHGIIFPCENKDVLLFPRQINGEYVCYHRPNPSYHFTPPEMWIAHSPDLRYWGGHRPLHSGTGAWTAGRIGGGVPPLETPEGWLEIYHGNAKPTGEQAVGTYMAAAFLTPLDEPGRIIRHTPRPIMGPEREFERHGFVGDVVFPTGAVRRGEVLQVFYGAADENIGVVEFSMAELMDALEPV